MKRLIVSSGFIYSVSAKELVWIYRTVVSGSLWITCNARRGAHQGQDRGVVQRVLSGIHGDAHGGDLEVIADPGQYVKAFFLGDRSGASVLPT